VYAYPKDYQPWNFNYKGFGITLALFAGLTYSLIAYEHSLAKKTGRYERRTNSAYY